MHTPIGRRWADVPFAPRRVPFPYGLAVIGLGTLGVLASAPGQTIGVSAFTEPLIAALPLERVDLSAAYLFGTLTSGLILTHVGRFYDRVGARVTAPLAAAGLGLVLLLLSQCETASAWLGTRLAGVLSPTWAATLVMAIGFFLLRFLGQGALTLVSRNMIMKWFDSRRGLANGISSVFISLGFSLTPTLFNDLIQATDWRSAWQILALAIGGGFALFAWATFRDTPEACELPVDAGLTPPKENPIFRVHRNFTLPEARRTATFWIFALSLSMFSLFITALTFHIASIFGESGMTSDEAYWIFVPSSILAVVINLAAGVLSDRVRLKYLLIVTNVALAAMMTSVMLLRPGAPVWLLIAGNGAAGGLFGVLAGVTWPKCYGRTHLGAISGMAMSMLVVASALGPYLFSLSLDWTGGYRAAGACCLAVTATLLVASFRADNPQEALAPGEDGGNTPPPDGNA